MENSRRSRRVSDASSNEMATPPPQALSTRPGLRPRFLCCTEIVGLPDSFCCDGCMRFKSSRHKHKPREQFALRELQCFKAWTKTEAKVKKNELSHWQKVTDFIQNNHFISPESLQKDSDEENNNDNNNNVEDDNGDGDSSCAVAPTPNKKKRQINFVENVFFVEGERFAIMVPSTHKIEHRSDISRWHRGCEMLMNMRNKIQQKQFTTTLIFSQALWAIMLAATPALPLSAAQHLFPLVMLAFFQDTGFFDQDDLFDKDVKTKKFVTSFPSDWVLRQHTWRQAARDTIALGNTLLDMVVYLACDKGNKKGIGHFVKCLCWWDDEKQCVNAQMLDMDAAGGASEAAAEGVRAVAGAATHLLSGQCTDSGGGGVTDDLAKHLRLLGLCIQCDCLISICCLHALQLQLSNAAINTFREGALHRVNATQLLHSVYRLQDSLELHEWRCIMHKASVFASSFDENNIVAVDAAAGQREQNQPECKLEFRKAYARVSKFHTLFQQDALEDPTTVSLLKDTPCYKMQAPIFTRWWSVGSGASCTFDCCLYVYHACQQVINVYPSGSTPVLIASDLFSMMSNQETFLDMTLLCCFCKAHVNPHFDWFQRATDLTNKIAFQSHNVVSRFWLMERDLRHICWGRSVNQCKEACELFNFEDAVPDDNVALIQERAKHLHKLTIFMKLAHASLMKHFNRWLNPSMLPAALLSETPLAQVVTAAMLQVPMPKFESIFDKNSGLYPCASTAHFGRTIELKSLCNFVWKQIEVADADGDDRECTQLAMEAAQRVLTGVDLRSCDCDCPEHGAFRRIMHKKCLAVPSQTQFVESGVKDAKHVSATDRSEQARTNMAIVRSNAPLTRAKENANAEKIRALVKSAKERAEPHETMMKDQVNGECDDRFRFVSSSLTRRGHFSEVRAAKKRATVDERGPVHKKQNVAQQL